MEGSGGPDPGSVQVMTDFESGSTTLIVSYGYDSYRLEKLGYGPHNKLSCGGS
jgi:hypothetical protein